MAKLPKCSIGVLAGVYLKKTKFFF